jgi:hypothetical protein
VGYGPHYDGANDYSFAIGTCERVLNARDKCMVNLLGRVHLRVENSRGQLFLTPMFVVGEPNVLCLLWMAIFIGRVPSDISGSAGFYALHDWSMGRPTENVGCSHLEKMGTPAQIIEHIDELEKSGVTCLAAMIFLAQTYDELVDGVAQFAREVMPSFARK